MVKVARFDIFLVELDPARGSGIKKTRPCVIISPNEMNDHLNNIIIAPMTTKGKPYPTRVVIEFAQKAGFIVLDQIRTIDKSRLIKQLGTLSKVNKEKTLSILRAMFAE